MADTIADNLSTVRADLPEHVTLVAVSKTKPVSDLQAAYDAGQRVFGENKAQEMAAKHPELPNDIDWHFIGHLQTNKVKYIAPFAAMIHAVDSLKLLREINKRAQQNDRVIDCLLQLRIAKEETKFGLTPDALSSLLEAPEFAELQHVRIRGLMGMATFTENQAQIKEEFALLKDQFDRLQQDQFADRDAFSVVSMGMSGDYALAIEAGSNMVRIGSAIFGARNYQ